MKLTDEQRAQVVEGCQKGATIPQIARQFGISESTVDRVLRTQRRAGGKIALRRGRPRKTTWRPPEMRPRFDIRPISPKLVREMCEQHHVYGSAGAYAVYAFAVFEGEKPVAAFAWSSPILGAAQSVCPEAPYAVLALSRMVAVPRTERALRHISKPLRYQMRCLIDRTRWPVLVTYSDEGQGHTGHVYKCSGWKPTKRIERVFYLDENGYRRSAPSRTVPNLRYGGKTTMQRWEHHICNPNEASVWMARHGWRRVSDGSSTKWVRK